MINPYEAGKPGVPQSVDLPRVEQPNNSKGCLMLTV